MEFQKLVRYASFESSVTFDLLQLYWIKLKFSTVWKVKQYYVLLSVEYLPISAKNVHFEILFMVRLV